MAFLAGLLVGWVTCAPLVLIALALAKIAADADNDRP